MTCTLTKDLIQDLINLIPSNLELLNKSLKYEIRLKFIPNRKNFGVKISADDWDFQVVWILSDKDSYQKLPSYAQIIIDRFVQDCFEHIPEFQKRKLLQNKDGGITGYPILVATLHGFQFDENGYIEMLEYPPSTLEKLCESYKQVMSK